jgi:3-oxoacid CoA-transferase
MGGAMDLVASQNKVIVVMMHTNKQKIKIKSSCSLPLTGKNVVDLIITEMGVFKVDKAEGLTLLEHAPGVTVAEIQALTDAPFRISEDLKPMDSP